MCDPKSKRRMGANMGREKERDTEAMNKRHRDHERPTETEIPRDQYTHIDQRQ